MEEDDPVSISNFNDPCTFVVNKHRVETGMKMEAVVVELPKLHSTTTKGFVTSPGSADTTTTCSSTPSSHSSNTSPTSAKAIENCVSPTSPMSSSASSSSPSSAPGPSRSGAGGGSCSEGSADSAAAAAADSSKGHRARGVVDNDVVVAKTGLTEGAGG